MTKQHRRTWQRHEQHIAEVLGTQRKQSGEPGADVVTAAWSIECKSWRQLPAKVVAALQQAERSAIAGQTAVAVLHEVGARHDADLVVLRWRDFAALLIGNHDDDRRLAERVAAIAELANADRALVEVLAPDTLTDDADEQEALHSHLCGLWGE